MARVDLNNQIKAALQALAVLCGLLILSMVAHKSFNDISSLAQQYSGVDFWAALARQVVRNLAGG
jgi:hypothetical protein